MKLSNVISNLGLALLLVLFMVLGCGEKTGQNNDPGNVAQVVAHAGPIQKLIKKGGKALEDAIEEQAGNLLIPVSDTDKKLAEAAYYSFKRRIVHMNENVRVRAVHIQRNSVYHRPLTMIYGRNFKVSDVTFYFNANLPEGYPGVTFGEQAFISKSYGRYNPNNWNSGQLEILVHEMAHVAQYRRLGGEKKFAHRYFGQIAKSFRDIINNEEHPAEMMFVHDDLGLEKEATGMERKTRIVRLQNLGRGPQNGKYLDVSGLSVSLSGTDRPSGTEWLLTEGTKYVTLQNFAEGRGSTFKYLDVNRIPQVILSTKGSGTSWTMKKRGDGEFQFKSKAKGDHGGKYLDVNRDGSLTVSPRGSGTVWRVIDVKGDGYLYTDE